MVTLCALCSSHWEMYYNEPDKTRTPALRKRVGLSSQQPWKPVKKEKNRRRPCAALCLCQLSNMPLACLLSSKLFIWSSLSAPPPPTGQLPDRARAAKLGQHSSGSSSGSLLAGLAPGLDSSSLPASQFSASPFQLAHSYPHPPTHIHITS